MASLFPTMENLKLFLITWNVVGRPPMSDLRSLLNLTEPVDVVQLPDIYAIGLQEVSVKPQDLIIDAIFYDPWINAFREILCDYEYIKVKQMRMQGVMSMVFCKKEHLTHIRGVQTDYTRTGFGGMWGNKGGVTIRLNIYGGSICIVNSHLAPHDDALLLRISDYNNILDKQRFIDPQTENIITHDYVFWIGDLNFRIDDLSSEEIMDLIRNNNYSSILIKDQLNLVQKRGEAFSEFQETSPSFLPTYKFIVDGNEYDYEKRKPAYTDRILYRFTRDAYSHTDLEIKQLHYSSLPEYTQSDHKPVSSSFLIKIFPDPLETNVIFLPIRKWKSHQDGEAIYYFNDNYEPNEWDWIGLYKCNFSGLDEHINYVWASTKPISGPSSTSESKLESVPLSYQTSQGSPSKLDNKSLQEKCPEKKMEQSIKNSTLGKQSSGPIYYRVTFVDKVPLVPGIYQLVYIKSEFNDVLGMSSAFQVASD